MGGIYFGGAVFGWANLYPLLPPRTYLDKYPEKGSAYSDKYPEKGSAYSDKYLEKGSAYSDKY